MAGSVAYVGNTNELELIGFRRTGDVYLNGARVVVAVRDTHRPRCCRRKMAASYVLRRGTDGDYIVGFSHEMALTAGAKYTAIIDADASEPSDAEHARWEYPFTARLRKK